MSTDSVPETAADPTTTEAPKAPKAPPTKGKWDSFPGEDYTIVGFDTAAPNESAHRILHILHQPARLVGIKQRGTSDLEATVRESGNVIRMPVLYVEFKLDGEVEKLVVAGRRRVLTGRALGIPVPGIKMDPADPNLWKVIRSENSAREAPSALELSSDVRIMLAGDKILGIEPMGFEEVGGVFGMSALWARAMAKIGEASPKVQQAVESGAISPTHAYEIAMEKTHEAQDALLVRCLEENLSVAQLKARRAQAKSGGTAPAEGAAPEGTEGAAPVKTVMSTTKIRDILGGLDEKLAEIHEVEATLDADPKAKVSCNVFSQPTGEIDDLDTQRSKLLAVYNTVRAILGEDEFGVVEGDDATLDPGGESMLIHATVVASSGRGEAVRKQALQAAKDAADTEAKAKKDAAAKERADKKVIADKAKADKAAAAEAKKQAALEAARTKDAAKATAPLPGQESLPAAGPTTTAGTV